MRCHAPPSLLSRKASAMGTLRRLASTRASMSAGTGTLARMRRSSPTSPSTSRTEKRDMSARPSASPVNVTLPPSRGSGRPAGGAVCAVCAADAAKAPATSPEAASLAAAEARLHAALCSGQCVRWQTAAQ